MRERLVRNAVARASTPLDEIGLEVRCNETMAHSAFPRTAAHALAMSSSTIQSDMTTCVIVVLRAKASIVARRSARRARCHSDDPVNT